MKIIPVSKVNFRNIKKQNKSSISENGNSVGGNYHSGNKHLSLFLATLLLPTIITGPSYSNNNKEIEKIANQRISEIVNLEEQQSEYKFDEIENEGIRSYLESLATEHKSDISRLSELNFKFDEIPKDLRKVIIKGNGGDGNSNSDMSIDELAEMFESSMNPKDKKHQSGQEKIKQAYKIYKTKVILDTVKENQELLNNLLSNFKGDIRDLSPKEILENFTYNMEVIDKCKSSVPKIKDQYYEWSDPNFPWVTNNRRSLQEFTDFVHYRLKYFIGDDADTIEKIDMSKVDLLTNSLNDGENSSLSKKNEPSVPFEELEIWCNSVMDINKNIDHFKSVLISIEELKNHKDRGAGLENWFFNTEWYNNRIKKKLKQAQSSEPK